MSVGKDIPMVQNSIRNLGNPRKSAPCEQSVYILQHDLF